MKVLFLFVWSFVNVNAFFCGNPGKLDSKAKFNCPCIAGFSKRNKQNKTREDSMIFRQI